MSATFAYFLFLGGAAATALGLYLGLRAVKLL